MLDLRDQYLEIWGFQMKREQLFNNFREGGK